MLVNPRNEIFFKDFFAPGYFIANFFMGEIFLFCRLTAGAESGMMIAVREF